MAARAGWKWRSDRRQDWRAAASSAGSASHPSWLQTILPEDETSTSHGWS